MVGVDEPDNTKECYKALYLAILYHFSGSRETEKNSVTNRNKLEWLFSSFMSELESITAVALGT